MYAAEPCVKFPCERCRAWITAAQRASMVVCPWCEREQDADADRMWHFSINGRTILLGRDEWHQPESAEQRLAAERREVERLVAGTSTQGRTELAVAQLAAIDAAVALCRRLAARPL